MKLKQFGLLTWKNFLLQWRHPWLSLLELLTPVVFAVITLILRRQVTSTYYPHPTIFEEFSFDQLPPIDEPFLFPWVLLYAPNNSHIKEIMKNVEGQVKMITIQGFETEEEMEKIYLSKFLLQAQTIASVVFPYEAENTELDSNAVFKIRPKAIPKGEENPLGQKSVSWQTSLTFPVFQLPGPRSNKTWGGEPGYMSQGFLTIQNAVGRAIMEYFARRNNSNLLLNQIDSVEAKLQRFPYPPFNDDLFLVALQFFFPMILLFCYIFPAMNITKNLVIEKEKRIKESMKMMGLATWLHWMAWFAKSAIILFITTVIITALLCSETSGSIAVLDKSNPFLFFFFLLIYGFSVISFSFLISTLFSKANISGAGAGIIFFIAFIPYFGIYTQYHTLSQTAKIFLCLISNTALSLGCMLFAMWEGTGAGVQWKHINLAVSPDDTLTIGIVIAMMAVDGIIYLLLTWYIDAVYPGEYGIPQPFYFPFTKTYWFGTEVQVEDDLTHETYISSFNGNDSDINVGIQIKGLSKTYDKSKGFAVKNISLNMQEGEITALLGHNGAGKSTTISMLTGLFPPSSGTALINGYDIRFNMNKVRENLGICPQHDVLFDDLTVKEHLYFFCKLKNCPMQFIKEETENMLTDIGLYSKQDCLARTLSGGMKRKLSIGIALIAGSKIVILDEPTSGMDPSARRFAWDLLQREKIKRTILLTTHFMEEADILADYIAIMVNGDIQCQGTSLNLKKRFGAGYHLVIVKEPSCNADAITQLVHNHVPQAMLESNVGAELSFSLPHESSHLFEKLFDEIEINRKQLLISSYGASITTMEEVFLKVGEYSSVGMNILNTPKNIRSSSNTSLVTYLSNSQDCTIEGAETVSAPKSYYNTGLVLFIEQMRALLLKRILHTFRNALLTTAQLIIPALLMSLVLVVIQYLPNLMVSPPLELTLKPFKGTDTVLYDNCSNDFSREIVYGYEEYMISEVDKIDQIREHSGNILDYLLNIGKSDISDYTLRYILSTVLKCDVNSHVLNITALFNNQPYHSPAIALSALQNSILVALFNSTKYKITTINHPLPKTSVEKASNPLPEMTEAYQISQNAIIGMSFLIASFSVFLVKELSSKAKHLQKVSGVNLFTFWITTFFWDMLNYLVPCILLMIIFIAFGTKGLSTSEMQGYLLLLFIFHGFSALTLIYNLSFLFEVPATAYISLSMFYMLYGNACLIVVSIMKIPTLGSLELSKSLDWIFSVVSPPFCLGRSIGSLYNNYQFNLACSNDTIQTECNYDSPFFNIVKPCCKGKCDDVCLDRTDNYLAWELPGIGSKLVFLSIQFVFFMLLLACIELNLHQSLKNFVLRIVKFRNVIIPNESTEYIITRDDDVENEHHRILHTPLNTLIQTEMVIFYEITKYYQKNCSVNKLSLGIKRGECFGLLGLNGAGKTTTFKMLTGDTSLSSGDAFLEGYSVQHAIRKVQQRIGYCPQFGGLIDCLTGREILTLFARLRGVPERNISAHITRLGEMLYFTSHIDKVVKGYSGGTQRKLSTAVALIGDPPVIFLDEPSTGMDPVARRHLWDALITVIRRGQSIILTSHSMEECEALCSRLVIMVNGHLCCLGSPQHLKSKYGQGYTLIIKTQKDLLNDRVNILHEEMKTSPNIQEENFSHEQNINLLQAFIQEKFTSSILKESHGGYLHYHIPDPKMTWAQIFGIMESIKSKFNIEDYSVGQTSLEQIFLNFVKIQR